MLAWINGRKMYRTLSTTQPVQNHFYFCDIFYRSHNKKPTLNGVYIILPVPTKHWTGETIYTSICICSVFSSFQRVFIDLTLLVVNTVQILVFWKVVLLYCDYIRPLRTRGSAKLLESIFKWNQIVKSSKREQLENIT